MTMHRGQRTACRVLVAAAILFWASACVRPNIPATSPDRVLPPPSDEASAAPRPAPPPSAPAREPTLPPPDPPVLPEDEFSARTLEEINREALLQPVFFTYDSIELDGVALEAIQANVTTLEWYANWSITIEGHCDSRGTPEYNLALGERRALAVRDHLVNRGIDAARIRTISYGEEFPFAPGEHEDAWAANRRVHFVITAR